MDLTTNLPGGLYLFLLLGHVHAVHVQSFTKFDIHEQ